MYGATDANGANPEIDVDAVIVRHSLTDNMSEYEIFDYDHLAVNIWDMQKWSDGSLVFFSQRRQQEYFSERDLVIEKILPDGGRIDLYSMLIEQSDIGQLPNMTVLANGNIVFQILDQQLSGNRWRVVSEEGVYLFDINFGASVFHPDNVKVSDIIRLVDGGFLAVGRYVDFTDIQDGIGREDNGLLMKVEDNGELGWIRSYRNTHEDTGEYAESYLSAAIELPNGDIVATGSVRQETSDLWVLKVDSNGCLDEDNCGELTTSVDVTPQLTRQLVNVWPNPVVGKHIQVEVSNELSPPYQVTLYAPSGKVIMSNQLEEHRSTITLPNEMLSGMIHLQLRKGGQILYSKGVVVSD